MPYARDLRFTENYKAAADEIEQHGGRVIHRFSKRAFVALLPEEAIADLKLSAAEETFSLTAAERLLIGAWRGRRAGPSELSAGAGELEHPRNPSSDRELARQEHDAMAALSMLGFVPKDYSTVLRGSAAVGIFVVSGPTDDLVISDADRQKEVSQFIDGADFLIDGELRASISFSYTVHPVSMNARNTPSSWRDLYFTCELAGHVFLFWQSEAGWAAVREILDWGTATAPRPGFVDILELWSANWNPDYRVYMPFTLTVNGSLSQYFLTANTVSGAVNIRQIQFDATTYAITVDEPAWSRDWNPQYTVYMPFTLTVSGSLNQYFLTANTVSGAVSIRQIRYDTATQTIVVDEPTWSRNWNPDYTVYMPFTLTVSGSLNQYFLTANTVSGAVNIRQIRYDTATQTIVVDEPTWSGNWNPDYWVYMPFTLTVSGSLNQYFLTANTVSGAVNIRQIWYDTATQAIVVSEPVWSRDWNPQYTIYVPFVYKGYQFFLTANVVTGNTIIRQISYDTATNTIIVHEPTFDTDWKYERREGAWRDAALRSLGFRPGLFGLNDYRTALRTQQGTDWSYSVFVTRYGVQHVGYAGAGRVVVQFEGKNAPAPDVTFAHETGHIFGAADEYASSNCSLTTNGYYRVQNRNCENVNDHSAKCLMNNNDWVRVPVEPRAVRVGFLYRARAILAGRDAVDHRPGS